MEGISGPPINCRLIMIDKREHISANTSETKNSIIIANKYILDNEIGKGSFATVYKGHSILNKEENIAIKAVPKSTLKNKKLLENLEIEIAILKKIKHPHIVSLIDCERTNFDFFLIMEYCALGDLTFFIKKRKNLVEKHPLIKTVFKKYPPPSEYHNGLNRVLVLNYLKQLASVLKFLRSKNLVHRDIKPQNLLLSTPLIDYHDSETFHKIGFVGVYNLPILKIADFGFARFLPNTSLAETLCGSPLYMAPEILNYQKYNAKADLWSVGAVLYEMCCGKPPFRASNHLELFQKIKKANDTIVFPKSCELESEMIELICGLLTFDPSKRMGFNEFFSSPIVNEDLSIYELESTLDLEYKPKETVESNMLISESLSERPVTFDSNNIPSHPILNLGAEEGLQLKQDFSKTEDNITPMNKNHIDQDRNCYSDLMLEKDYVVVEKRSVEVNALADEFAHAGSGAQGIGIIDHTSANYLPRRTLAQKTTDVLKKSIGNSSPTGNSSVSRRASLIDRRISISSLGATNALSKALGMASLRLFGHQNDRLSTSPSAHQSNSVLFNPQIFHELTENIILKANHQLDCSRNNEVSDSTILPMLESLAAKAFVIYSFAEVKFSQIIPLPSSLTQDGFIKKLSGENFHSEVEDDKYNNQIPINDLKSAFPDGNFSQYTVRPDLASDLATKELNQLCNEALSLYLKILSILAHAMNLTSKWWYQSKEKNCSLALNVLVQWIRERFNECLEKAKFLKIKFLSFNESLNINQENDSTFTTNNDCEANEPVFFEKLIYDRALEISKIAANIEMQGEFLENCELAYATSLWMLESLLDKIGDDGPYIIGCSALDDADRVMIKKYVDSIANRLKSLGKKLNH